MKNDFLMDLQLMMMEMANNVIRHAPESLVQACVASSNNKLEVRWEQQSKGYQKAEGSGFGLLSIQNRLVKWHGKREEKGVPFSYYISFELAEVSVD